MITPTARPLLLGHRGVRPRARLGARSKNLPAENTIAAFEYALTQGCDGFEFDVRFTRDRQCVVCHDPKVFDKIVSATDYADLHQGSQWLAVLDDVLARFGKKAYLDIEVKVAGGEEQVIAALRVAPPSLGYVVSSFLPEVLVRLRQLDDTLPLGYICDRQEFARLWTELAISVFIPQHTLVSREMIDAVHRHGLKLFSWTVNQGRDLVRLANWGVDGLISDDPEMLSRTFR